MCKPAFDFNRIGADELTASNNRFDFISLQQHIDATCERIDDLLFSLEHGCQIKTDSTGGNAVFREVSFGLSVKMARLEQRLAWDTANAEASAAEFRVLVDHRHP